MLITNFASGELSEKLNGRVDLNRYYQGVSYLSNFDIVPTGGVQRRVGFERLAKINECRIIPFILNKDISFILEFVPGFIYIWKNGIKLETYIETPYLSLSEIKEIQYAQNYDTMIFCHRNYKPFQIKYDFAFESFEYGDIPFNFYPEISLDDDYDFVIVAEDELPIKDATVDGSLSFNGKVVKGDKAYCVLKGILYKYNTAELKWEIDGTDSETKFDLFNSEGNYPGCVTFFNSRLVFASSKNNIQKVWFSASPDTDGVRYFDFFTYKKFVTVNKVIKDPDMHIFTCDILQENINKSKNTTLLTNVTQNLSKDGVLEKDVKSYFCSGTYISIGAKVLEITENTILIDVAVNTEEDLKAQTCTIQLWRNSESASADDYEFSVVNNNLTTGDCSFNFEVASEQNDAIKWLGTSKYLTIGTESSVWACPASINALSIQAEMSGKYGSDEIQGFCVDTAMIFFAQGKKGIREYYFNSQTEAFQTNNIAIMAEQMLSESAAVDFDFITNPYNRIVITREDGKIVTLLYDKNNGVMGWNRIIHGNGKFKSVAVVRGDDDSDIVYVVVEDNGQFFLERLNPNVSNFLDSFQLYSVEKSEEYQSDTSILFNQSKNKLCYLNDIPADFMAENDIVYIGYKFVSLLKSMPIVANDVTAKKRITNLLVRFVNSFMPIIKCGDLPDEHFNNEKESFSGVKSVIYPGNSERDVTFTIHIDNPVRCNILSVNAKVV